MTKPEQKTFVLIHGAFRGGWAWDRVLPLLQQAGHVVFAPTLSNASDATLSSCANEVVAVIRDNDLHNVTLVGHSQGGVVAQAAAEIVAERIAGIVFLDAPVLHDGEAAIDVFPAEMLAQMAPIDRDAIRQPTPLAAIIDAVKHHLDIDSAEIGTEIHDILKRARVRSGDLPLIIIVDTAIDRSGRVQRNDGADLAQIAAFCKENGIFLGTALDDDIAGADGDNVAISANFEIDYIDQEHLQRAVNAKVFVKETRKQSELRAIYDSIRTAISGFRWSEERFSSLYPLHPVTLEITPFVRRYFPSFSILDFASSSGDKIMSRPADSLLGL